MVAGQGDSCQIVPSPPQENTGVREFLWNPDGKWICYEYTEKRDVAEGEWPWRNSIRKVNIEGGNSEEIIAYPPPDEEGAPGNTALAAWIGSRIYLWQCEIMSVSIMADGCPLFSLDFDKKQNDVGVVSLLYPDFLSFSPDSKMLAVSEGSDRLTWTNKRVALINEVSQEKKILTAPEVTAFSPTWSPDGSHLAYVAGPDIGSDFIGESGPLAGMAKRRIWVMRADGSEQQQLTGDGGYREERPIWLANGKHILFARLDEQDHVSLWLVQKDGKSLQRVTDALSSHLTKYEIRDYYGKLSGEKLYDLSDGHRFGECKTVGTIKLVPTLPGSITCAKIL